MPPNPLTPDQDREVRRELAAGRSIQAIKLYREYTGVGLKEAKDAVEAMRDETAAPLVPAAGTATRSVFEGAADAAPTAADRLIPDGARRDVERLLFDGKKIQAVRILCTATGWGLKEAKDAADAIEAELRRDQPLRFRAADLQKTGGCLGVVLSLLAITTVAAAFATAAAAHFWLG